MNTLPFVLLTACCVGDPPPLPDSDAVLETIAFGSCNREDRSQDFWTTIGGHEPDLCLMIGDNVYADIRRDDRGREVMAPARDAEEIEAAYRALGDHAQWRRFAAETPVLATWDDHDFGNNDAGSEWELKRESQRILLDFYEEPEDSARRTRDGVHHAWSFGPSGRRVQIILLDTRFFRDPLLRKTDPEQPGRYRPNPDPEADLLGEDQWSWLEARLREPADLRIVGSSVQVVPWEHGWECWGNFPAARARLFDLVGRTGAEGVVFVSGDRHLVEISCERGEDGVPVPYPMWDFTSSGLNQGGDGFVDEPNRYRVGPALRSPNFGLIEIDWDASTGPLVTFEARNADDDVLLGESIELATLAPIPPKRPQNEHLTP